MTRGAPVADGPIEAAAGRERSDVRLLVATPDGLLHRRFRDLPEVLTPGDVLVVNTSATVPAAVPVLDAPGGRIVHFSGQQRDGAWLVEVRHRCAHGSVPDASGQPPGDLALPGAGLRLRAPFTTPAGPSRRLWRAELRIGDGRSGGPPPTEEPGTDDSGTDRPGIGREALRWLADVGRPIRYGCASTTWPLSAYQTVFATTPGSAEMPSAARPFTHRLVTRLVSAGVDFAPLVLHTGVSSLEQGEQPYPEWFAVPTRTAEVIDAARRGGRRIIAVGTTVVRALASATVDGRVAAARGWTELVVSADHPATVVDGLITGWHEDGATHLDLLRTVAGKELVAASYEAAHRHGYRWHEFGDSHLLLPPRP